MTALTKSLRSDFRDLALRRADAEVSLAEGTAADLLDNLNAGLETGLKQFSNAIRETTLTLPNGNEILAGEYETLRALALNNRISLDDLLRKIVVKNFRIIEAHFDWLGLDDITPLAGLSKLEWLYVIGNRIADISPLAGLTELEFLDVRRNQLTDVSPLADFASLKDLYLSHNPITDLAPLASLINLRVAWLDAVLGDVSPDVVKSLNARGVEVGAAVPR